MYKDSRGNEQKSVEWLHQAEAFYKLQDYLLDSGYTLTEADNIISLANNNRGFKLLSEYRDKSNKLFEYVMEI